MLDRLPTGARRAVWAFLHDPTVSRAVALSRATRRHADEAWGVVAARKRVAVPPGCAPLEALRVQPRPAGDRGLVVLLDVLLPRGMPAGGALALTQGVLLQIRVTLRNSGAEPLYIVIPGRGLQETVFVRWRDAAGREFRAPPRRDTQPRRPRGPGKTGARKRRGPRPAPPRPDPVPAGTPVVRLPPVGPAGRGPRRRTRGPPAPRALAIALAPGEEYVESAVLATLTDPSHSLWRAALVDQAAGYAATPTFQGQRSLLGLDGTVTAAPRGQPHRLSFELGTLHERDFLGPPHMVHGVCGSPGLREWEGRLEARSRLLCVAA